MNITPDLNIHDQFTNERISINLDKHSLWTQKITLLNKLATCLRAWLYEPQRNVN